MPLLHPAGTALRGLPSAPDQERVNCPVAGPIASVAAPSSPNSCGARPVRPGRTSARPDPPGRPPHPGALRRLFDSLSDQLQRAAVAQPLAQGRQWRHSRAVRQRPERLNRRVPGPRGPGAVSGDLAERRLGQVPEGARALRKALALAERAVPGDALQEADVLVGHPGGDIAVVVARDALRERHEAKPRRDLPEEGRCADGLDVAFRGGAPFRARSGGFARLRMRQDLHPGRALLRRHRLQVRPRRLGPGVAGVGQAGAGALQQLRDLALDLAVVGTGDLLDLRIQLLQQGAQRGGQTAVLLVAAYLPQAAAPVAVVVAVLLRRGQQELQVVRRVGQVAGE